VKVANALKDDVLLSRKEALEPVGRWTAHKKASLLLAIEKGNVTPAEVLEAHGIDEAELANWKRGVEIFGRDALRATNPCGLLRGVS
jgi:hypothetical protein